MTPAQAKVLKGKINVLVETEKMWVRAKTDFTSNGRLHKWAHKAREARRSVAEYVDSITKGAP